MMTLAELELVQTAPQHAPRQCTLILLLPPSLLCSASKTCPSEMSTAAQIPCSISSMQVRSAGYISWLKPSFPCPMLQKVGMAILHVVYCLVGESSAGEVCCVVRAVQGGQSAEGNLDLTFFLISSSSVNLLQVSPKTENTFVHPSCNKGLYVQPCRNAGSC